MNNSARSKTMEMRLQEKWQTAIEQLFSYARKSDEQKFFLALKAMPIVRKKVLKEKISYVDDYMDIELSEAIDTHSILAESARNKEFKKGTRMKLMLIAFLCLLEADRWHSILGNLLGTIVEKDYESNLLRNKDTRTKYYSIVQLLDMCERKGVVLSIQHSYKNICNENIARLRNPFFHSQYWLSPQGDWLVMTKNIIKCISTQPGRKQQKLCYSFDEVKKMYENIVAFLKALASKRKQALEDFSK